MLLEDVTIPSRLILPSIRDEYEREMPRASLMPSCVTSNGASSKPSMS